MDVFISERDFGAWIEQTGKPDPRPGAIGQIAFVLSKTTGRVEMVGCASWDDERKLSALGRKEVLAHAERIKFSQPEALPRLTYDFERLQKAIRGDAYVPLPWPNRIAPVGHLHLAALKTGLRLLLSRAISGGKAKIDREVGSVSEDQVRYTSATDFEEFADKLKKLRREPGDSPLTERKDAVLEFLSRPQMLDVWAAKVAPFVFEYALGTDASEILRKFDLSADQLNRAFERMYKIAAGEEKLERTFTAWTPPTEAFRNARLPQPVQEQNIYFYPDSAAYRRFVKMYGEDNRRVTAEVTGNGKPKQKKYDDLDFALQYAELTGVPPEALDLAWPRMKVVAKILGPGGPAHESDVSGYDHEGIDRLSRDKATPDFFANWLGRVGLTAREFARLARLAPKAVEEFVAGRRDGSVVMRRRLLLVFSAFEELHREMNETRTPWERETDKYIDIIAELCLNCDIARDEALEILRDGIWVNFLQSVGAARLADEEARLQLTGEGVVEAT